MTFDDFFKKYKELDLFAKEKFLKETAKQQDIPLAELRRAVKEAEKKESGSAEKDVAQAEFLQRALDEAKSGKVAGLSVFFDISVGKYVYKIVTERQIGGKTERYKKLEFGGVGEVRKMLQEAAKKNIGATLPAKKLLDIVEWIPAYFKGYSPHKPPLYSVTESQLEAKNMCELPGLLVKLRKEKEEKNGEKGISYGHAVALIEKELPETYTLLKNLFVKHEYIEYFVNWLAYIVQTLQKTRNAVVLVGEQGTGKGVLWENIIAPMFGADNCVVATNSDIQSDFNVIFDNRLFVCFNEIKGDFRQGNTVYEKLKMYITDPDFMVNIKTLSQYRVENHFNCIFFSNHEVPLQIEGGDRRYSVFKTSDKKLKDIVPDIVKFVEAVRVQRARLTEILFSVDYDAHYATSLIETEQKKKIEELSNTKQDLIKKAIARGNVDYFAGKLGDLIDGHEDERAIEKMTVGDDGQRVAERFRLTNKEYYDEFLKNVQFGVFSNEVLRWAYKFLVSDGDSDIKMFRFWGYVLDDAAQIGKKRERCRMMKDAEKALLWDTLYIRNGERWEEAGDAAEVLVEIEDPDGNVEERKTLPF